MDNGIDYEEFGGQYVNHLKSQIPKSPEAFLILNNSLRLLEQVLRKADAKLEAFPPSEDDDLKEKITVFGLCSTINRLAQGLFLLCLWDLKESCFILLRSMMEAYFDLSILITEDQKYPKKIMAFYFQEHIKGQVQVARAKRGLIWEPYIVDYLKNTEPLIEEDFERGLNQLKMTKQDLADIWESNSVEAKAKLCGLKALYDYFYPLLSDYVHPGPRIIYRYYVDTETQETDEIVKKDIVDIVVIFNQILLPVIHIATHWFEIEYDPDNIAVIMKRFKEYLHREEPGVQPITGEM